MVVQQAIRQIVRALRQRKGLTQKELASKIQGKVDYSYIGKIERGGTTAIPQDPRAVK